MDLVGERYGLLQVVEEGVPYVSPVGHKNRTWVCVCDCGNIVTVAHSNLRSGHVNKSCGCQKATIMGDNFKTHGMSDSRLYVIWLQIKARCDNPQSTSFKNYGARGISYSEEWSTFEKFVEDMGEDYEDHLTIERVDVNLGYCKENCVWATYSEQARNKRKMVNNTSGFTGVSKKLDRGWEYWVAFWSDLGGKRRSKSFSIKKYGDSEAFKMAVSYRESMIKELNSQGAGYSETHGE